MFSDEDDTSYVRRAIAGGVSAYVAMGTPKEHIKSVIDIALARFEQEEKLHKALQTARTQLEERKLLDRAKGLLMSRHNLTEQDAYARLRKAAMDKGIKIAEMAQRLIDAADLLG